VREVKGDLRELGRMGGRNEGIKEGRVERRKEEMN
jgi:hypothetical protein